MRYRLAVIGDEVSQEYREVIEFCTYNHLEGIEIRSVWCTPPLELSRQQCYSIRCLSEDAGLSLACFDSPVGKVNIPTSRRALENERRRLEAAVERAHWLGIPMVRVFSFLRQEGTDPLRSADVLRELYGSIDYGVKLVIETGTETNTPTVASTLTMLDIAGQDVDNVGILWDPGNRWFAGYNENTMDAVQSSGERLAHIHVKDPAGTRAYVRIGQGVLDWATIMRTLKKSGYAGWYSLETHYRLGKTLTAAQRRTPWGSKFSEGGLEASQECVEALAAIDALLAASKDSAVLSQTAGRMMNPRHKFFTDEPESVT